MTRTISHIGRRGGIPFGHGKLYLKRIDITSYTTGGESLTASELGMSRIDSIHAFNSEPAQNADHMLSWDRANNKLMAHVLSTGLQVAAAVDLGTHEVWVLGR